MFLHHLHILTADFSAYQIVAGTDLTSKAHQGMESLQESNPEKRGLLFSVGVAQLEAAGMEKKGPLKGPW